jgi:hypothetical protein
MKEINRKKEVTVPGANLEQYEDAHMAKILAEIKEEVLSGEHRDPGLDSLKSRLRGLGRADLSSRETSKSCDGTTSTQRPRCHD